MRKISHLCCRLDRSKRAFFSNEPPFAGIAARHCFEYIRQPPAWSHARAEMVATMASPCILYLAVEGVLLRGTLAPPKLARGEIYLSVDGAHVAQLNGLLVDERHIDIVLTSSWVNTAGFHCVLDLLPESLRAHVVGATIPGNRSLRHRLSQNTSKSEWLAEDVRRREPQVVTVLESDARHVPVPLRDEAVIVPKGLWAAGHDDWSRLRQMLARAG